MHVPVRKERSVHVEVRNACASEEICACKSKCLALGVTVEKKTTDGNKATDPTGTHLWGAGSREIVYVSRDCRLRYVDILLGVLFFVNLLTRKSWYIFWHIYWKCVFSYTNNVSKYTSTYLFDIGRCRLLKTWCESCWQVEKNLNGLCGCIVEWDASQGRWKALGNQRISEG